MASTATGGAARGSFNPPHPNPSGDGGPTLRSQPGKGSKPAALADITNTGRPNATRAVGVADLVKENAKLLALLNEKAKIIDLSRVEIHKLRLALQSSRQQNLHLAQTNSQMLAEINAGKDRIKTLQHDLSCTTALLKVKGSELDRKKKAANEQRKGVKSQVLKATDSIIAAVGTHHNSVTSGVEHHLVQTQSEVPSNIVCLEPPQDAKQKRNPERRRSLRLHQGYCEISGVSQNTLQEDIASAASTSSVQKQYGRTTGKDMGQSLQNKCSATVHEAVMASEFEEIKINEQPQKTNLKERREVCSREAGFHSHKIGDKACNSKQSHLAEIQPSLPFNTMEPPKPPEENGIRRGLKRRSATVDINTKIDSTTGEPSCQEKNRTSQTRKSARLSSVSSVDTNITVETVGEDDIAPLAGFSLNVSRELRTNQEQTDDCSSRESNEWQISGRRSLRRAAEKVVSYKEIPLNVKMRRP